MYVCMYHLCVYPHVYMYVHLCRVKHIRFQEYCESNVCRIAFYLFRLIGVFLYLRLSLSLSLSVHRIYHVVAVNTFDNTFLIPT